MHNAWVLLRANKIAEIGQGAPPKDYDGIVRRDLHGKFLIPGLFDAHVHLQSIPGLTVPLYQKHPKLVDAYFRQLPRSYLYHGFTTVLDLAPTSREFLKELRQQEIVPDILQCGPPMPVLNGYPMVFLPEGMRMRVYPNALVDPDSAQVLPKGITADRHSPSAALDRVQQAEGLCAKTFVEDGFGNRAVWPYPSHKLLRDLVSQANQRKIPLAVHANSLEAYRRSLAAGVRMLVHGMWTWDEATTLDDGNTLPKPVEAVLTSLVASRVSVMPTLRVLAGDGALFDPSFLEDSALTAVLPAELIEWYRSPDGAWFAKAMLEQLPPDQRNPQAARAIHERAISRALRVSQFLVHQNASILFGSDTPSGPSYGNPPGYNGYLELQALAKAGMPLDRLLSAATLDNARAFAVEDRYGSIEVSKIANLLVLRRNPLEDVSAYDAIESIILRGRIIERSLLRADL